MAATVNRCRFVSLGALWLGLVGILVWLHARESVWPPIYDAYTYFSKAKSVWESFQAGHFGPAYLLAIEPTFRPFGTVLMSFPFGFTTDFRGFYFRSTFFPVALVCMAGFVGSWTPTPSRRYASHAALTACFLSTLSLFFYFELYTGGPPPIYHWGLVDGFFTGLAALTTSACVRAVRQRSVAWSIAAVAIALLMIFVKPTGLVLAAICGAILGIGWLWILKKDWRTSLRGKTLRLLSIVLVVESIGLGGGALAALKSQYLGAANLMYGNAAIDVMRAELQIDWLTQFQIAIDGLGPFVLIWVAAMASIWLSVRLRRSSSAPGFSGLDDLLMLLGATIFLGGLWFWIFGSGGRTFVRYFAPFLYVAIFCTLPVLLKALDQTSVFARRAVGLLMAGTLVNLVLLLALPNPSLRWQQWSGVSVKSGIHPESIDMAQAVLKAPHAEGRSTIAVYSLTESVADAMFDAVFNLHSLTAKTPRYIVRRPVDWQRPTAIRIEEIISSDYIIANPEVVRATAPEIIETFAEESVAFNAWALNLTHEDGVERITSEPDVLLLRIADRAKLRASLERLVVAHRWRDVFVDANPRKWWSDAMIRIQVAKSAPGTSSADEVDFGLVEVHEARLELDSDGSVALKVWLRVKQDFSGDGWVMLVHILDAKHDAIANRDMALGSIEQGELEAPYRYFRSRYVLPKDARWIAIGFYRGSTLLAADKGERDWDGKRLLLQVPPSGAR